MRQALRARKYRLSKCWADAPRKGEKMNDIPTELLAFIRNHAMDSPSCIGCMHSCCFESGFAIKKNVELIYSIYNNGKLVRKDYTFKPNLTYDEFVNIYFDVIKYVPYNFTMYFPRHLAYNNVALIINPDEKNDYWTYRHTILNDQVNECKGCIFLESSMSYHDRTSRKCILHQEENIGKISEKPIDCILLSCNSLQNVKKLTQEEHHQFFLMLQKLYGDQE